MNPNDNTELRQKLIQHIHRPIGWAKVGKRNDVYLLDVEQTDKLAESMADYALQLIADHDAQLEQDLLAEFVAKGAEKRFCEQIIKHIFHGAEE